MDKSGQISWENFPQHATPLSRRQIRGRVGNEHAFKLQAGFAPDIRLRPFDGFDMLTASRLRATTDECRG
jgi:hypothetical protein